MVSVICIVLVVLCNDAVEKVSCKDLDKFLFFDVLVPLCLICAGLVGESLSWRHCILLDLEVMH